MDRFRGHHLAPREDLFEEVSEAVSMLGAHHQVKFWNPSQQGFPFLLSHTTGDGQDEVGVILFAFGLSAEIGIDLLFSVVADGAGVVEDEVSQVRVFCGLEVEGFENPGHPFRVSLVHLTAKGGDVIAAGGYGHGVSFACEVFRGILILATWGGRSPQVLKSP